METVTVVNSTKRLLHLPPMAKGEGGKELAFPLLVPPLAPPHVEKNPGGETLVPTTLWESAKKHRAVKQWLRLGWIREKPIEAPAPEDEVLADLLALGVPAAGALIETEKSEQTLRTWLGADSRQPVKDAIIRRLSAIKKR